jgi:ribosomal protein L11
LTRKDLEEIAELKKGGMNTDNVESIIKAVIGTAKNMGVTIS